jgi:hypothetical protein
MNNKRKMEKKKKTTHALHVATAILGATAQERYQNSQVREKTEY